MSSKLGLEGLPRVAAPEAEREGVDANAVGPGGRVDTDILAHLQAAEWGSILDAT